MKKLIVAIAVCVALLGAGCSTPLSLRGARVMEPGEVEVLFSPQVQLPAVIAAGGGQSLVGPIQPFGWAEASARFGLFDRLDMQLRIDPSIIPEVSVGYQLLGDPARTDDFALSLTAGVKPSFLFVATNVSVPLQVLVEVPLTDMLAFTGGVRIIPSVFSTLGIANFFAFAPGVVAGIRVKAGNFVFQPELGLSGNLPVGASVAGQNIGFLGQGFVAGSVAATVGLNVGGQFDFRPPQPARAPEATAATPVTDTPAALPAPAPVDLDPAAPPPPAAPY